MKRFLVGLACGFLSVSAFAATTAAVQSDKDNGNNLIRPAITLQSVDAVKTTEKSGDEIYLAIIEYHSNGRSKYYTVPQSPVYWPSSALSQITNLQLWQGKLKDGESQEVIISVVEQDTPPWNMDDLIGVMKVKIRNENGKMIYEWYKDTTAIANSGMTHEYDFKADNGEYKAKFTLKLVPDTKPAPAKGK